MQEGFSTDRKIVAKKMKIEPSSLEACGERIRQGKLVAFPTETVYGLGADATNEKAVLGIFEAKGRPLTDPVIVHIADYGLFDKIVVDGPEKELIRYLGSQLWPGPLTMIGPCNTDFIPSMVGSNTGTVGVRWPKNITAQQLILATQRPIAAPSANRFMHVSPTKPDHVFYDLYDKDIVILDGEQTSFGVESSVLRIMQTPEGKLEGVLLRSGTLELTDIKAALEKNEEYSSVEVKVKKKTECVEEDQESVAPGQLLKHYSPNIDCLLVEKSTLAENSSIDLSHTGIIDVGAQLVSFKEQSLHYVDLSVLNNHKESLTNLYLALRECEVIKGVNRILVLYQEEGYEDGSFGYTLFDKIYRSAAGKRLEGSQ